MRFLLISYFFFFAVTSSAQQKSESQIKIEIEKLHKNTDFIRDSISKLISISNHKLKESKIPAKTKKLYLTLDSLYNISDKNDIDELKLDFEYTKKHSYSLYSFQLVHQQISRQPGKNFYDEYEQIYRNASKEIKNSDSGKKMAEQLTYFKKSKVGSIAPSFSGKDINGKVFSLKDFKGKYVLIDFWASWCAPCREELPYIKKFYSKYKKRGFEVISVSIDKDLQKLKTAISKEDIGNWKHFATIQNTTDIEKDYFLNGIPHKVLIDKNGKIIGKWKGSGELNKNSLEKQLKELFK